MTGFAAARKTALAAALVLLAGCQIVPGAGPQREAAPAQQTPQPQRGAAVPQPLRPAERHQVALLVPLSGPNAGVGSSIQNAARLALADANEQRIELKVYDTATRGAAAAARDALIAGARLFLGPLTAEDARAVGPVARRVGVPVIGFSNDRQVAGNGVYLLGFTPEQSIRRVVAHARATGATRFAALIPTGEYGERARLAFRDAVGDAGGRLAGVAFFDRTPAAVNQAVVRVATGPAADAVLIADTGNIARAAAPALRRGPLRAARLLGTELWGNEAGLGRTPALVGARFAAVPDAVFGQLVRRYRAQTGRTPYRLGSLGYDATLLAIRVARDWQIGRPFPTDRLLDRGGFSGVDGAFRFRRDGTAERMLAIIEVTPAGERVVDPAPATFAD